MEQPPPLQDDLMLGIFIDYGILSGASVYDVSVLEKIEVPDFERG